MKRILIVAAHPDDEVLGCGATVARLVKEGFEAFTLILGEGVTSRDKTRDIKKRGNELTELKKQILKANGALGVKDSFIYNFPDNRFDTVALLDIVKIIESIIEKIKPGIIFTHYENDLNIDHRIAYQAVLTAARPLPGQPVKEIYSFEIPSSTEYNYPYRFSPEVFFEISKTLQYKLEAIKIYKSELRSFPHPRSIEGIKLNAQHWGMRAGLECAEAFKSVRLIR